MAKILGVRQKLEALHSIYRIPKEHLVEIWEVGSVRLEADEHVYPIGNDWETERARKELSERYPSAIVRSAFQPGTTHNALSALYKIPQKREIAFSGIYHDLWHRAWYAYPLIVAAAEAEKLGLSSLTVIEFGVWRGDGLLNMASICELISASTGLAFQVVGFDTGKGLPSVADFRDHPELWYTGELVMPDSEALRKRLPANCELILGDIANTLPDFLRRLRKDSPIGFVALDVDTYSSSVDALRLFEADAELLLPVVPIYVDDSYVELSQCSFAGEALAIREFNEKHPFRKIDHKPIVRAGRELLPWQLAMYFAHVFDHPVRKGESPKRMLGLRVHKF